MAISFLVPSVERIVLYIYFIVIFLAHVLYGIGVVSVCVWGGKLVVCGVSLW